MGKIILNGSSYMGGGSGIDYSTLEQDTGLKWIDGRPIYQKVYYANSIANNVSYKVDANFTPSVYDNSWAYELTWHYTFNNNLFSNLTAFGGGGGHIRVTSDNTNGLVIRNHATTVTATDIYVVIRYTKVADLPQS